MHRLPVTTATILVSVLLTILLWPVSQSLLAQDSPPASATANDYPPDPHADIEWTGAGDSVAVVQAQFNNARSGESAQLGISLAPLTMPSQAAWDAMSDGEKALWFVNQERTARGLLPLDSVETNVSQVAQSYAEFLLTNNLWGHDADGLSPWDRLHANPAIGACYDFLAVSENLYVTMTTATTPNRIAVERAFYSWMYEDTTSGWGHRHAILWTPYDDNSGAPGREGFLGLGHAQGAYTGPWNPSFRWPNADMIVLNLFDPCATWSYAAQPTPTMPNTPTPTVRATATIRATPTVRATPTGLDEKLYVPRLLGALAGGDTPY